mgnify:CR=1 FL=1
MSASDVKAFFDKVNSDPALKAKAKAIGTSDYSKVSAFAKELGFSFSAKDMHDHFSDILASSDLNEDDLSSVAGGTVSATAAAVVGAGVAVGTAVTGVTSTTSGSGW